MTSSSIKNLLPYFEGRNDYFRFLDRWIAGTVDGLGDHMSPRAMIKAYLLETSRDHGIRDAAGALESLDQRVEAVDETLFRVRAPGERHDWALMEVDSQRYPVLYTALESEEANRRISHLVAGSPLLDRVWLSTPLFEQLWDLVLRAFPPSRYSRLVFEHESVYEANLDTLEEGPRDDNLLDDEIEQRLDEDDAEAEADGRRIVPPERRKARILIGERIGRLDRALVAMRQHYQPLSSIVSLRIPAPERGGHEVYFDGRCTNRSDSVVSLRQSIRTISGLYGYVTSAAEKVTWPTTGSEEAPAGRITLGAPVLITFSEPLSPETFERWIAALGRKENKFRIWGEPIRRGSGKVHLYAVDNHLWQPIDLELTREYVYALLPAGTCGNTIHRLITNLQRFVDPKLQTFIGDRPFSDVIHQAPVAGHAGESPDG